MKKIVLTILAMAAVVGCSKESNDGMDGTLSGDSVVSFTSDEIETRTANDNQWEAGDKIGIFSSGFATDYSNVEYYATTNVDSTTTGFAVVTSGKEILYPNVSQSSGSTVNFYAYYPYSSTLNNDGTLSVNITTQKGDIGAVDYMIASVSGVSYYVGNSYSDVKFAFEHKLSKVVMNISCNNNISSLSGLAATLQNIATTASYSITTGAQSSGSLGDVGSVDLTVDDSGVTTATVTAILHPATYDSTTTLLFELNGKKYSVPFAATLGASNSHTFTLSLGNDVTGFESGNTIGTWGGDSNSSATLYPEQVQTI